MIPTPTVEELDELYRRAVTANPRLRRPVAKAAALLRRNALRCEGDGRWRCLSERGRATNDWNSAWTITGSAQEGFACTCPDYAEAGHRAGRYVFCKHTIAVIFALELLQERSPSHE